MGCMYNYGQKPERQKTVFSTGVFRGRDKVQIHVFCDFWVQNTLFFRIFSGQNIKSQFNFSFFCLRDSRK